MNTEISCFTDCYHVTVYGKFQEGLGNLVYLTKHSEAMSFIFPMKPEQARAMAAALIAEADSLDGAVMIPVYPENLA